MALAPPASPSLALARPAGRLELARGPDVLIRGAPGGGGIGQSDKQANAGQGVRSVPDSQGEYGQSG